MTETEAEVIADPHVINFKKQYFDFMGEHNKYFNMVCSSNFLLNVKMSEYKKIIQSCQKLAWLLKNLMGLF